MSGARRSSPPQDACRNVRPDLWEKKTGKRRGFRARNARVRGARTVPTLGEEEHLSEKTKRGATTPARRKRDDTSTHTREHAPRQRAERLARRPRLPRPRRRAAVRRGRRRRRLRCTLLVGVPVPRNERKDSLRYTSHAPPLVRLRLLQHPPDPLLTPSPLLTQRRMSYRRALREGRLGPLPADSRPRARRRRHEGWTQRHQAQSRRRRRGRVHGGLLLRLPLVPRVRGAVLPERQCIDLRRGNQVRPRRTGRQTHARRVQRRVRREPAVLLQAASRIGGRRRRRV